jgi:hypothetical protein
VTVGRTRKEVSLLSKRKPKEIIEDTRSGSLAYNRLDMQISQAVQMAVELYSELDYLLILDHYDDITVFDNENSPAVVSYYQMKTHEEAITINTVIRKKWLPKLYAHFKDSQWIVKELGLITNCPLTVNASSKEGIPAKRYVAEKTAFEKFDPVTQSKIKADIGKALSIQEDEVDLSKFVHMRTTLTIARHKEIAEQEMNTFLSNAYPRITMEMAKTIFNTLVELLTQRQSHETLDRLADFETIRRYKGISKNDFRRVIDNALIVCIPNFDDIIQWSGYHESEEKNLSLAYVNVITDEQRHSEIQRSLFVKIRDYISENPQQPSETMYEYAERVRLGIDSISPIYNSLYVLVVVTSILINNWRRNDA